MGKRGKASRKRNRDNNDSAPPSSLASKILKKHHANEHQKETLSDDDGDTGLLHGISNEALNTTMATLQRLCRLSNINEKPAIKDKRYKNLRRLLYELQTSLGVQVSSKSAGITSNGLSFTSMGVNVISSSKITNDITEQIENGAWDKAVITLRNLERIEEIKRLMHETSGDDGANDASSGQYRPKLGALQRWVREIDAAGTDDPLALEVLDAMLRVVAPESIVTIDESDLARASWAKLGVGMGVYDDQNVDSKEGCIRLFPAFTAGVSTCDELNTNITYQPSNDVFDKLVSNMTCGNDGIRRISEVNTITRDGCFRVCGHEDGADRKPPNKFDLDLITTSVFNEKQMLYDNEDYRTISACNVLFTPVDNSYPAIKSTAIPYVQGTFLLENVLSPHECDRMIAAAEMAGYSPDEPLAGQPGDSVLAHACVWVVDHQMERTIFNRVKDFLPSYKESEPKKQQSSNGEGQDTESYHPLGVNRRFRFYRYVPGRYYRPHIDGAWPSSGFDINGDYRYDVNDVSNKNGVQFVQQEGTSKEIVDTNINDQDQSSTRHQLSRLTFLIYLNDDFDGGHTTFFMPAKDKEGVLNAFPVRPCRGCVLVFPHGTCAAPLHEGSPVLKGCKYVVRTEVEYYV
jgi:hypothetical protein